MLRIPTCEREPLLVVETSGLLKQKMDDKEKTLESPFRWHISNDLACSYNEADEPWTPFDEQPVLCLMTSVLITYCRAMQQNLQGALDSLIKTDDIWNQFDHSQHVQDGISTRVLQHIVKATEFDLYLLTKNSSQAERVLNEVVDSRCFEDNIEKSTVDGCKSLIFSCFHFAGHESAIKYANCAISKHDQCALWHYVLGKNLRHKRRHQNGKFEPSQEEMNALLKCSELSDEPFYSIQVAQMYREKKMFDISKKIYEKIYEKKPLGITINLRIARAFIQSKELVKAEKCLAQVEKQSPNNSMFLHYKGLFYEKQRDWKKAAEYFKKAAECGNFKPDLQYAQSMKKADKNFDIIKHLESIKSKYKDVVFSQQILLYIGLQLYSKNDINKALVNFLQAIQLDQNSEQLEEFWDTFVPKWISYNIFDLISGTLLPEFHKRHPRGIPFDMQDTIRSLELLCMRHKEKNNNEITKSLKTMTISS